MVHARYGNKDAILEAFLREYVKRLNPDPDPKTSGMQQVLATRRLLERNGIPVTVVTGAGTGTWEYVAGFEGVILLMILTIFAAFVPIVGSAIIWVPCSLWLLVEDHMVAGIVLA